MNKDKLMRVWSVVPWWAWLAIAGVLGFWLWKKFRPAPGDPLAPALTTWSGQPGFSTPTNN